MPAKFDNCVKSGGKVRTKSVHGGYLHICKKNGKWTAGHVKHYKR